MIVRNFFVFPSGCILAHKNFLREARDVFSQVINNGKRTEWSPIRPVIIRVINKIVRGRPIAIAIAERIGRHKILLLINHSHNKICNILSSLKNTGYSESFLLEVKIKSHLIARAWWRVLSNYLGMIGIVLLVSKSGQVIANQNWVFCCSSDYYNNMYGEW